MNQENPQSASHFDYYESLGHLNIAVDDIQEATEFYQRVLGVQPVQEFPQFKNVGFAKSAGFLENPKDIEVSVRFLAIPNTDILLELMQYHKPQGENRCQDLTVADIAGVRHIAIKVNNIDKAFEHIKKQSGVKLINPSPEYRPFKIDKIAPHEFNFFDQELNANTEEKEKVCEVVGQIRYFYFVDQYGVQWEFEQGHD